ncbi:MAG: DUF962 domain-containing protein [Polaromonas sp.]|uniref:Mpo1 family 2-hydroxy fatty acid dioxygenase n=1 Tax=Polaromonas sp. TaxID=1869339 RepID=UPI00273027F6|nr:Mpo1-like protein [Polaromonas sp.]MDP1743006.1 DUF962 domain-containing protein [Polaromonas sp.]MDP3354805.1 DUF962 domain-containing protein [Polaromonas sp.]MDP3750610.1 DUF962 domain-containing protein [Polaromonas sp.]
MTQTVDSSAAAETRQVDRLLAHYGESHQNPKNEIIHFIAIPLIMLSLLGMIFGLHPYAAYAFIGASMVYYARLSLVFFGTMVVWSAILLALVHAMGERVLPLSLGIFIGAWILQFVGHRLEGKKPSFFEDIQYLWVGPLFVLSKLFGKIGVRW